MNIFYLSKNTRKCARAHCDKHVVKMILEYTQLLFSLYHDTVSETCPADKLFEGCPKVYKNTHKNHPCAVWVRESSVHFDWLLDLAWALCKEYTHRYGRVHSSQAILQWMMANRVVNPNTVFKVWQEPPQCFGPFQDTCYIEGNAKKAYRSYYALGKSHILVYTRRKKPKWLEQALEKQSK